MCSISNGFYYRNLAITPHSAALWLPLPGGSEGFPGGSDGRICLQCGRPGFDPWVWNIPWRREQQPTPVFLPGESHGQRNLVGYIQSMGLQRVGPLFCAAVQDSQHFLTRGGPSPTLAEHPGSHGPSFWAWPLVPLLLWVTLDTFGLSVWYLWSLNMICQVSSLPRVEFLLQSLQLHQVGRHFMSQIFTKFASC